MVVRPDADVVALELEPNAPGEAERLDVRARELEAPGPVEHGVLRGDDLVIALRGDRSVAQDLAADPPVADRDRPVHLVADERVVRGDDDRHAE